MNWELWVIAALCVALLIQSIRVDRLYNKITQQRISASNLIASLRFKLSESGYAALEKGADEQQESFEQEYLTWNEQKTNLEFKSLQLLGDVRYLLGLVYDYEEVTLDDEEAQEKVAEIHEYQRHQEGAAFTRP